MSNANPNQQIENIRSIGTKTNISERTMRTSHEDLPAVFFFVRTSEDAGRREGSELVGGPSAQEHSLDRTEWEVSSQAWSFS